MDRASNLLDGRTESIWHSNYGGAGQGDQDYPHNVVITFGKDVTFQSFSYTPRKKEKTQTEISRDMNCMHQQHRKNLIMLQKIGENRSQKAILSTMV